MAVRRRSAVVEDSLKTFHRFARLPTELRLKIWTCNLPGPRIVEIKCSTEQLYTSELRQGDNGAATFTSTSSLPVNLHVCRESRFEALRRYQLLFKVPPQTGRVYLDPLRDTLYFGARRGIMTSETLFSTFVALVEPGDLDHVRHVAVNEGLISYGSGAVQLIADFLCQASQHLPNLDEVTFICDDSNPIYSSEAVFVEPSIRNRILERQICEAVAVAGNHQPQFRSPLWRIQAIAAEPACPKYDQSILGYKGSRAEFFKHVQLPRWERGMARLQCAIRV
ncbi:hypothetical protein GGR54DRAFT_635624 [Hypoxylon sp. NC1633]|nr:hypothetical protein GGR54DRAFT_635624 [Hypoxylon sp. NC1633]